MLFRLLWYSMISLSIQVIQLAKYQLVKYADQSTIQSNVYSMNTHLLA